MDYTTILAQVLMIISVLTVFVNIITEVAKNAITWLDTTGKINVFVLVLSEVLTVASCVAYWQYQGLDLAWYLIVGFLVVGIMVAYAAMFGYDKLISYFSSVTSGD